jgi:hypothetical protein
MKLSVFSWGLIGSCGTVVHRAGPEVGSFARVAWNPRRNDKQM